MKLCRSIGDGIGITSLNSLCGSTLQFGASRGLLYLTPLVKPLLASRNCGGYHALMLSICLSTRSFVCRLWNLLNDSLRGST